MTIGKVVQALQRGGHVRLTRSIDDARISIAEATAKGTAALLKARAARLNLIERMLSRKSHGDVALLGKALEAVFPQAR